MTTIKTAQTVVVKIGGACLAQLDQCRQLAQELVHLHRQGTQLVVVHGGGPQVTSMLNRLGIATEFVHGLRRTTPEAMDVVRMVLAGQVQRELVTAINAHQPIAVGITGEDTCLLRVKRRTGIATDGSEVDLGLVGEVTEVNPSVLQTLLDNGHIPVVTSIGIGSDGNSYNVNADTASAAIATALNADLLLLLTDVDGLYRTWPPAEHENRPIAQITTDELEVLIANLHGGILPKMQACLTAVQSGKVAAARVLNARYLLQGQRFQGQGLQGLAGTEVVQ